MLIFSVVIFVFSTLTLWLSKIYVHHILEVTDLDFEITSTRANRDQSCCSSTILSPAVIFIFMPALLHVFSCLFFIGDHRLTFPEVKRSAMKVSARLLPISGSLTSDYICSDNTLFVTILHRSLAFSVNGFVNP